MKRLSCVIVDGEGPGEPATSLSAELVRRGHLVTMLGGKLETRACAELLFEVRPHRVIFAPSEQDECAALDSDLTDPHSGYLTPLVSAGVMRFLELAQAAIRVLMSNGGGQIWVADWDDTFEYHTPLPCTPLQAEARAAAVRSMAKECTRLGIKINSLSVQPVAEMYSPNQLRVASNGLKTYAMRYKPMPCAAVASQLCDFLEQHDLPMAGAMVGVGMGVCQGNLVQ